MITKDDFLGGRIILSQPKKGYRVTSDSVFLAASLNLKPDERILDVGAGSGAILCCLAARLSENIGTITMHGIEIQQDLLSLANENALNNGFADNIQYYKGNILDDIIYCEPNSYHHVVSNPPYYEKEKIKPSPYISKATAQSGDNINLDIWIKRCLRMVRPQGYLTLIHRADRLDDIISSLMPKAGSITVFPFWPAKDKDANRVIIRAQKDAKGFLSLKSGLIVHKSDGKYTPTAEKILRHGHSLDILK